MINKVNWIQHKLIDQLADELYQINDKDLSSITILLPTQRLAMLLDLKLSQKFGAYLPPQFLTLYQLFDHCFADQNAILNQNTLLYLLPILLKSFKNNNIHSNNVSNYLNILEDIYLSKNPLEYSHHLMDYLNKDIYRNNEFNQIMRARMEDLASLDQEISKFSNEKSLIPYYKSIYQLNIQFDKTKYNAPTPHIWIAGLTTIRPQELSLLNKIIAPVDSRWFFSNLQNIEGTQNPFSDIITATNSEFYFKTSDNIHSSKFVVKCQSPYEEVRFAREQVLKLISKGVQHEHIYIGVTNEKLYGSLLLNEFQRYQIPCNFALGNKLSHSIFATYIQALLLGIQNSENLDKLDLYLFDLYKKNTQNDLLSGYGKFSSEQYQKEISHYGDNKAYLSIPSHQQIDIQSFLEILIDALKPLKVFDSKNWDNIEYLCQNLERNSLLQNLKMTLLDWFMCLSEELKQHEEHVSGSALSGVQILRLSELRWIPCPYLILLGCQDGDLPSLHFDESILELAHKKHLQLPTPEQLEWIESLHLEMLKNNTNKLILCYSQSVQGQQRLAAAILQKWLAYGDIQAIDYKAETSITASINKELPSWTSTLEQSSSFSASSLNDFLHCPFKYELKKSKIKTFETPEQLKKRQEGIQLHQIIHEFFRTLKTIASPQFATEQDYLKILIDQTDRILNPNSYALSIQLKTHSWPRLVKFLANSVLKSNTAESIEAIRSEYDLRPHRAILKAKQREFTMNGRIDFMTILPENGWLIDFKKSSCPTLSDMTKLVDIQMPFYMSAIQQINFKISQNNFNIAYWSILKGELLTTIELDPTNKKYKSFFAAQQRMQNALTWRIQNVEKSSAFADASQCGFCNYQEICRISDPHWYHHYQNNQTLNQFVTNEGHIEE